jgi:hypothetical protein
VGDPTLITAFIGLTGVLTVLLGFVLGKKISGNFLGLVYAALLAVSPVVISLTSQIWSPDLIPIFIMTTLFIILGIYQKKSIFLYFLLGIFLSLIIDMEIVVGLLFSAGIIISLVVSRKLYRIKNALLVIAGFLLVLSPRIIFDFRHEHLLTKTLIIGIKNMFFRNSNAGSINIIEKLKTIFSLWNDTLAFHNPLIGTILLIFVVLAFIMWFKKAKTTIRFFSTIVGLTIVVTIVGIILFGHDIWPHYLVALPLLFVFLLSLAFTFLYNEKKFSKVTLVIVAILVVGIFNPWSMVHSMSIPLWEGDASVYRNQTNAVDYVYKMAKGKNFKYIVYTPPVYDYTYRYLFQWYGGKEYGYQPTDKNPYYLFVIIEPDYQFPDRITQWLKVRENDGKIISESKQKGGIIIQTRILDKND